MVIANLFQKRKQYIYEGCDGKNSSMLPRNSYSGFSIGFFWGNGECIEHHHSMSSYAKKLLEVLHIDSSWWPWLFKNFVVVTAAYIGEISSFWSRCL